ncbi:hypothetical protein PGTUg99_025071 [Puccinia graminis f. sp. tritici]|uniref:Uncharacterized protein n=1 Tax=Puccinia graminis f. sp. tritici TaxID=56615 RepID=A0A5B0SBS3_PUCGR|nr:hypothetical protein PGTUg99_007576 [Puccinia graminis f. sp. tritici]KAA1135438.1 hypothetical protein PGTUg99_025071 [Puccinia graminis f. sp. tritici]
MCPSESLPMYLGANSLIAVRAMIWISSERPTIHTHSSGISNTYTAGGFRKDTDEPRASPTKYRPRDPKHRPGDSRVTALSLLRLQERHPRVTEGRVTGTLTFLRNHDAPVTTWQHLRPARLPGTV